MNRRVRVLLSLVALVALVAAVAGCSSGSDSDRGAAVATTALPTTTLAAGPSSGWLARAGPAGPAAQRALERTGRARVALAQPRPWPTTTSS
jgi:hypothetical protein